MKWRTDSEPISPPEPVITATGMSSLAESRPHGALVGRHPLEDVLEHSAGPAPRPPLGRAAQARAVGEVDPHVAGASLAGPEDPRPVTRELPAERRRLAQREAAPRASPDVDRRAVPVFGTEQLVLDQLRQVVGMKEVAHLLARASVADV